METIAAILKAGLEKTISFRQACDEIRKLKEITQENMSKVGVSCSFFENIIKGEEKVNGIEVFERIIKMFNLADEEAEKFRIIWEYEAIEMKSLDDPEMAVKLQYRKQCEKKENKPSPSPEDSPANNIVNILKPLIDKSPEAILFKERLKIMLDALIIKAATLSLGIGRSSSYISLLLNGTLKPYGDVAKSIAEALKLDEFSKNWLLSASDIQERKKAENPRKQKSSDIAEENLANIFKEGKKISELIKDFRELFNITAEDLEIKAGLSPKYITKLENGEYSPMEKTVKKIGQALGLKGKWTQKLCSASGISERRAVIKYSGESQAGEKIHSGKKEQGGASQKQFLEYLEELMKEAGFSNEQLSLKAGLGKDFLDNFFAGRLKATNRQLEYLANSLGLEEEKRKKFFALYLGEIKEVIEANKKNDISNQPSRNDAQVNSANQNGNGAALLIFIEALLSEKNYSWEDLGKEGILEADFICNGKSPDILNKLCLLIKLLKLSEETTGLLANVFSRCHEELCALTIKGQGVEFIKMAFTAHQLSQEYQDK
ncbi:MAG: helix-turn-helix transcriptional regulator [Patescibacteria group bacterium]